MNRLTSVRSKSMWLASVFMVVFLLFGWMATGLAQENIWDKTYGGSGDDGAFSLIQTTDGGYAVAGCTTSKGAGGKDFWVIKLDEQGNLK